MTLRAAVPGHALPDAGYASSMFATLAAEPLAGDVGARVTVSGELDVAAAPRLRVAVGELLGQGFRHVEVDLGDCTFIDSSGIGALVWAAHRLRAAGGDLVAVGVHGMIERTLELACIGAFVAVRS
jgi:anti-sigma B factor antagonist